MPITSFSELKLPSPLLTKLEEMALVTPTEIQAVVLPQGVSGKDIFAIAPTGTGKTLAFALPILAHLYPEPGKQALILAPTRELAAQIFRLMTKLSASLNLQGTLVVGGESFSRQRREIHAGVDFIVATPGRLNDHLGRGLCLSKVKTLVLDEVDRMLDMGFAPQVESVVKSMPAARQTFLFSATMPVSLEKLAHKYLKAPFRVNLATKKTLAPKIHEEKIETSDFEKPELLLKQLSNRTGKVLIFANTQRRVEMVRKNIARSGKEAAHIHAGLTQGERKRSLEAFRNGVVNILVATDVVSRGIDVLDIEHVINYDSAWTTEDYLHRIGRTGRMGKSGHAVTFIEGRGTGVRNKRRKLKFQTPSVKKLKDEPHSPHEQSAAKRGYRPKTSFQKRSWPQNVGYGAKREEESSFTGGKHHDFKKPFRGNQQKKKRRGAPIAFGKPFKAYQKPRSRQQGKSERPS